MKIVYTYVVPLKRNHADILSNGCSIKFRVRILILLKKKSNHFRLSFFSWFALCYNLGKHIWSPPDNSPWRLCSKKGNIGVLNSKARGQRWEHGGSWAQMLMIPICGAKSLICYLACIHYRSYSASGFTLSQFSEMYNNSTNIKILLRIKLINVFRNRE